MHELSAELGGRELLWRTDRRRTLWVLTELGGESYWVKVNAPVTLQPLTAVTLSLCASFVLALLGGVLLQRRIARPLETLATSAAAIGPHGGAAQLDETGPLEVASVARAFNAMNARLADAEADRRFVLAAVSHDMRTPLARLRLAIAMLAGRDPELEMSAVRQIDEIDRTVGQFIDFARGFEAEAPAPCDVVALARACTADAPGVAIESPEELVAEVRAEALRRGLVNLLENAAHHGAPPVTLQIMENRGSVRIAVRDSGPGVPRAQWESIRAPFVRAEDRRGVGGVGLGLAIVDRVARVHGGRLDLDAPASGGFSATLTLPMESHLSAF
jgi:two-component system osmolarity sensor histidine kinase EnvZ